MMVTGQRPEMRLRFEIHGEIGLPIAMVFLGGGRYIVLLLLGCMEI
jgi:hypothetical protein